MTSLKEKRLRKRFSCFLVCSGLLYLGLFTADPEIYPIYAMMVSGAFSIYLGGQSATDYAREKAKKATVE